jgi:hypothetical protein
MFIRQSLAVCVFSIALLALGACTQETKAPGGTPATTQSHGDPNAVPGSHEDWCGEHAVPESKCTRCTPALAAAFKATGDWCAEHGLPESQCLKCNPELKIVRPPKAGGK